MREHITLGEKWPQQASRHITAGRTALSHVIVNFLARLTN
jgi:hypothetical protein